MTASGSAGISCARSYLATDAADVSRPGAGVCADVINPAEARTAASTLTKTKRRRGKLIPQSYI